MKSIVILTISYLFLNFHIQAQNPLLQTKDWTIYKIQGHGLFAYSVNTLKNFSSYHLQDDSVKFHLNNAAELSPKGPVVWMGGYVVSYVQEGQLQKAEVSNHGGYIYDEKTGKYFEIPTELRPAWLAFFINSYTQLRPDIKTD
jgi:hypothetical protein